MYKSVRTWVKQEKRIVRLLYRKGLIDDFHFKVTDLYWASYKPNGRARKRRNSPKYRFTTCYPEIHYCSTDYWGESDEHSIVGHIKETFYWTHIDERNWNPNNGEFPKTLFRHFDRMKFIKYLSSLPTKRGDNKINKILSRVIEY